MKETPTTPAPNEDLLFGSKAILARKLGVSEREELTLALERYETALLLSRGPDKGRSAEWVFRARDRAERLRQVAARVALLVGEADHPPSKEAKAFAGAK